MRSKGLVISFNWIFVLIAGGLILAFFYSLARTHIETSTVKTARKVVSNFKIVLKTALASPKTVKKVKIPDFGISFYCRDNTSYYSVKGVSQDSDLDVIFSLKNFSCFEVLLTRDSFRRTQKIDFVMQNPGSTYLPERQTPILH